MTSLVVLTNAASKCDARNELYSYKISQFMNFISAAVFGFLPKNVGSYVLRSFMSKSNVKKRKNESF